MTGTRKILQKKKTKKKKILKNTKISIIIFDYVIFDRFGIYGI